MHPITFHAVLAMKADFRSKPRWDKEEEHLMAAYEVDHPLDLEINHDIKKYVLGYRIHDSIRSHRRKPAYFSLLAELRRARGLPSPRTLRRRAERRDPRPEPPRDLPGEHAAGAVVPASPPSPVAIAARAVVPDGPPVVGADSGSEAPSSPRGVAAAGPTGPA